MRPTEAYPTPPALRRVPAQPGNRLLTLLLGMFLGALVTLLVGGLVFGLGLLPIVEVQSSAAICPPTPGFYPLCPTCSARPEIMMITAETPTPTRNLSATATAACATYEGLFPGTPCP